MRFVQRVSSPSSGSWPTSGRPAWNDGRPRWKRTVGRDPYRASVLIEADPGRVFEYFTEPDALAKWMGGRAVLVPRPGGEFRLYISGVPVVGRYVEVDPPRRVVVT